MRNRFLAFAAVSLAACANVPVTAARGEDRSGADLMHQTYAFLHQNPELGGKEFLAHETLSSALRGMPGVHLVSSELAPTAVIGVFDTGKPGPTIALRAEMDARPLTIGTSEPESHSPRSTIDGVMHNCGHDAHAAILLGAAERMTGNPAGLSGQIVFLFQPAEEIKGGADDIVEEGLLTKLGVEAIFALHAAPGMPVGRAEIASGPAMAGSNYFDLVLTGRGSHAAVPFEGSDLPLTATHFVEALSQSPARQIDIANRPFVFSITRLIVDSGSKNVLPTEARIAGTLRAFEDIDVAPEGQGTSLRALTTDMITRLATAYDVEADFDLRKGSPPTINNVDLLQKMRPFIEDEWAGELALSNWQGMFSEDFSYYTAEIPALYFSLGIARDGLGTGGVHTPDFTIHPDALTYGRDLLVSLAKAASSAGQGEP